MGCSCSRKRPLAKFVISTQTTEPWPPMNVEATTQTDEPWPSEPLWQLPPNRFDEVFQPIWPDESGRYVLHPVATASNLNMELNIHQELAAETKENFQTVPNSVEWKKKNRSDLDFACVQSVLQSTCHSSISLSTKREIDRLLIQMNNIYAQLDANVEGRRKIVSAQSQEKIATIINDGRDVRETMLTFFRRRQSLQDELYNKWLQKYIVQLDKWKSVQMAEIQKEMVAHQASIMLHSQQLIDSVNIAANQLREMILVEEQADASRKIEEISKRIQAVSIDQLGILTKNEINLVIEGNLTMQASNHVSNISSGKHRSRSDKINKTDQLTEELLLDSVPARPPKKQSARKNVIDEYNDQDKKQQNMSDF